MTDAIVCGIDHRREWMLQVITYDSIKRTHSDFMWFFNTRAEAETRFEQVASHTKNQNAIVKIIKIRAFEHIGSEFELVENED